MTELNCRLLLRIRCCVAGPRDSVAEGVRLLLEASGRRVYVVGEQRRLLGLVPDYELLKCLLGGRSGARLESILSRHIETALASTLIADVAPLFREARHSELPVVDDDTHAFLGVLLRQDVLREVSAEVLGESFSARAITIPPSPVPDNVPAGPEEQWLKLEFSRIRIDQGQNAESTRKMPRFAETARDRTTSPDTWNSELR